jgi:hypothetical protein
MGFAGIRAPQKDYVRFLDFSVGTGAAPCPKNRRQTGDAWGVSSPVAGIDVIAADDGADEFLGGVVQFIGGFGTTEHAEGARAASFHFGTDTVSDTVKGFFPGGGAMLSIFTNQWCGESFARAAFHGFTSPANECQAALQSNVNANCLRLGRI